MLLKIQKMKLINKTSTFMFKVTVILTSFSKILLRIHFMLGFGISPKDILRT